MSIGGFASPNYTQTPNDLFDELLPGMGLAELKVVLAIVRHTFGYHREEIRLSIRDLARFTGMTAKSVMEGAEQAESHRLIERYQNGNKTTLWRAVVSVIPSNTPRNTRYHASVLPSITLVGVKESKETEKKMGADAPALPERRTDAQKRGNEMDGILFFAAQGQERAAQLGLSPEVLDAVESYPADCQQGIRLTYEKFKLIPPSKPKSGKGGEFALWIEGVRELNTICKRYNVTIQIAFEETYKRWNANPYDKKSPRSFAGPMVSALSTLSVREEKSDSTPEPKPEHHPVPRPAHIPKPTTFRPRVA